MCEIKESGIEWLGCIPSSWEIVPAGGIFQEVKEKNTDLRSTNPLQFKYGRIINKRFIGSLDNPMKETLRNYTCVVPDTIIINGLNLNYDFISQRVAIVRNPGAITSAYLAVKPNNDRIVPDYACYLLKGYDAIQVFHGMGSGVRKTLQWKDFKNLWLVLPPRDIQFRIVDKINKITLNLDSLIDNLESQIQKLTQYKQSLISETVISGLDSRVPKKDSRVDWIGLIPCHWHVVHLRWCASIRSGLTLGKKYLDNIKLLEYPYLRVANVQTGYVDIGNLKTVYVTKEEAEQYRLHTGEVLMTEGGDRDKLGRGCVWEGQVNPCLHQNHIFALTTKSILNPYFLSYVTASSVGRTYFDITAIKTTNLACTNSSKVMSFMLQLPPVEEQNEMVAWLDEKCAKIDELIALKEAKILKLTEYRKSLIYEYVTGKKEVV